MATTVAIEPNQTLVQINQFVAQSEMGLNGPLTAIGNKDGKTTIDINDLDPAGKPAKSSIVTTGSPPAGAKTIGKGKIYISGTLTDATAYKPA